MVHVSDCDGLNILAERLSPSQLDHLSRCYEEARAEGVSLRTS
ncbi:MAG: hypothetical protein Q8O76_09155 [Chloroflexota bacterium]|nr:hypothetical protein [Chloroflexota bacterium]